MARTSVKVTVIPPRRSQRRQSSVWRRSLGVLQVLTGTIAIATTLITAGVYVRTVQAQDEWNQLHRRLRQLQLDERHYVLTREELAQTLREAASQSQLVPLSPERVVTVPATPPRPLREAEEPAVPAPVQFPSGY